MAWQRTPVFLPGESPWTEEPGGLHSMGLQRVGHDWATKHIEHLKLKEFETTVGAEKSLWHSPVSMWKAPSLYQKEQRHSYHQKYEIWGWEIFTNKPCQTNPCLPSYIFTIYYPSPNPPALSSLHKCIVSLSKRYESILLWSLLWIFILHSFALSPSFRLIVWNHRSKSTSLFISCFIFNKEIS